ncbi:unannotated protein [freshwater metagenome]
MHAGMIGYDGEKMSKSKGNLVLVSTLVAQGTDPMAIRCALMSSHYSQDRMWSSAVLQEAENLLERLRRNLSREEVAPTSGVVQLLIAAISHDLDTPSALKALELWCEETESGLTGGKPGELSRAIDSLLGIAF